MSAGVRLAAIRLVERPLLPVVVEELGHTHPGLALRIYAAAMRRDDDENGRLGALIEGGLVTSDQSEGVQIESASSIPEAVSRS